MSMASAPASAPRLLFTRLLDDAALFPPGNAPMGRALTEHAEHRVGWYSDLVGPFLCPASRVGELQAALDAEPFEPGPLGISLVMDLDGDAAHGALRAVLTEPRLQMVMAEAVHARIGDAAGVIGRNIAERTEARGYLEAPRTGWEATLDAVAESDWHGAKWRTGGLEAAAVPSEDELAAFLRAAVDREVEVKLTAGLHHAIRHTDPATGMEEHGFLNVIAALRWALNGAEVPEMARILGLRDQVEILDTVERMSEPDALVLRQFFASFGCCRVTDPIGDLVALGLVPEGASA